MGRATAATASVGLLLLASVAGAATYYVHWNGSGDFTTIQAGMNAASNGDTVVVASGTYYITSPITYGGKEIMLRSEFNPESTIIDCQGSCRAVNFAGEGEGARLYGFTIRNGMTSGYGGAIYVGTGTEATISGCVITDCSAECGGGIYVYSSGVSVLDTEITRCSASESGGGVYCYNSSGSTFIALIVGGNTGGLGGGFYVWYGGPTIQLCTLYFNAGTDAGGIYCQDAHPMVLQSILSFSTAGKAVHCAGSSSPYVGYCDIYGNAGGDDVPCGTSFMNGSEDPLFCDIYEDDVRLCANSWCLPGGGNPMSALIGARGEGCPNCDTPVARSSWGNLKGMYR